MSPSKTSLTIQARDLAFIRGLFECRIMTLAHVAAIHFGGRREYTKKRVQKLKAFGFVSERPRRVNEPSILFLAKAGLLLLREHGILTEYSQFTLPALERRARVSEATVRHELAVMDVKAAFHTAVRGSATLSISEFGTWPRLYEFAAQHPQKGSVIVRPDGFLRIHETKDDGTIKEHVFFLEVDRSTEILDTIVSRAVCYLDYSRSGGFAERNGSQRDEFRKFPFRVLIVCKSAERRDNIAERMLQNCPQILTQALLATLPDVGSNPLDGIWIVPINYRTPENLEFLHIIEP